MLRDTITNIGSSGGPTIRLNDEGDILYYHDSKRDKYLSIYRLIYGFGIHNRNISHPRYMSMAGRNMAIYSGHVISRNSTIVAISGRTTNNSNCSFQILKNGTSVGSLSFSNVKISYNNDIDIDLNSGDYIQLLANPLTGVVNFPEITLEVSWRYQA